MKLSPHRHSNRLDQEPFRELAFGPEELAAVRELVRDLTGAIESMEQLIERGTADNTTITLTVPDGIAVEVRTSDGGLVVRGGLVMVDATSFSGWRR